MPYNFRKRVLNSSSTYVGLDDDCQSRDSKRLDPNYRWRTTGLRRKRTAATTTRGRGGRRNVRPTNGNAEAVVPEGPESNLSPAAIATLRGIRGRGRPPKIRRNDNNNNGGDVDGSGGAAVVQRCTRRRRSAKASNFSRYSVPEVAKRTVLSWLISSNVFKENDDVFYVDNEGVFEGLVGAGKVNAVGIICKCCSIQFTVGGFEEHLGRRTVMPCRHVYLSESRLSLFDCQLRAWENRDEVGNRGYNTVQPDAASGDKSDDACMICANGGDLICCDTCPSTFHKECIFLKAIPQDSWLCSNCICKDCGRGSSDNSRLHKCIQCDKNYHSNCKGERNDLNYPGSLFCEKTCCEIHEKLQTMVGARNNLKDGFSWTLLKRTDLPPAGSVSDEDLYKIVQVNSKVAVAWSVMNECFDSSIDRLTGANITQSIVYNRGSNLTRINYSGFYTVVLEKNDEIISVASIRVLGKRLAEMPFIGTRESYRNRGMGRMLEECIETAVTNMKVEKLVIPSVKDLASMWIERYFFSYIEDELKRELCTFNTVMFPNTVVKLYKTLFVPEPKPKTAPMIEPAPEPGLELMPVLEPIPVLEPELEPMPVPVPVLPDLNLDYFDLNLDYIEDE